MTNKRIRAPEGRPGRAGEKSQARRLHRRAATSRATAAARTRRRRPACSHARPSQGGEAIPTDGRGHRPGAPPAARACPTPTHSTPPGTAGRCLSCPRVGSAVAAPACALISNGLASGWRERSRAACPARCGAANELPVARIRAAVAPRRRRRRGRTPRTRPAATGCRTTRRDRATSWAATETTAANSDGYDGPGTLLAAQTSSVFAK